MMKNKMWNIIAAVLILGLLLPGVYAADRAHLDVSLQSYTPVPAEPGSYVRVTIKVLNDGDASATRAAIEFVDNYPFKVEEASEKVKTIGQLGAQADYLAEYRVRIDSDAVEGTNYLKVRYILDDTTDNWIEKELPLTISSVQKTVSINSVEVEPEMVAPGEQLSVVLRLKNMAPSALRDVGVKLDLEKSVLGTESIDIPLAPIGSSVEKRTAQLSSGQTAEFDFVLQAYPTATAGIYKVPVQLTYTDEDGNEFSRTDLIGIVINDVPDLMLQIDSSTLYSDNGVGEVTFSITNKGLSEIKFATIELEETDDFAVKSSSSIAYLGNIDSDDYETASFDVKMVQHGMTEVVLPLRLEFKDGLNKVHVVSEELSLPLITTAEAGEEKSHTGVVVIVVVVVVAIIFFVLHRRKKKRK